MNPDTVLSSKPAITTGAMTPAQEYLSFRVGSEEYAIDILKVQEIRSYEPPTRIAGAPAYVKGVVNLRGVIVPIADLRLRLYLDDIRYDAFTVVIVLNLTHSVVGMVVDSVSDVVRLRADDIRPAPDFSGNLDAGYIQGLATLNSTDSNGEEAQRMLILTDIEQLMADMQLNQNQQLH